RDRRRARARLHARGVAGHRCFRARARRVTRRARASRFPGARRREVSEAHSRLSQRGRSAATRLPRGQDHQLPAQGEDVLEMPDKKVTIHATRYDPDKDEKPRLQAYEIPFYDESMVVLDALNWIKSNVDGSLSYRW